MIYNKEDLIPVNDYILLEPLKPKEIYQYIELPDETKNKDKGVNEVKETKKVKNKIKVEYRIGKIVSMSQQKSPNDEYSVGDLVTYNYRQARTFDLLAKKDPDLKCPVIIKHWDVIAKVKNNN